MRVRPWAPRARGGGGGVGAPPPAGGGGVGGAAAAAVAHTPVPSPAGGRGAAAVVSMTRMTEPSLTLSPNATFSSFTVPAWLDGISIEALSDSTMINPVSTAMTSPGLTSNSMIATSLNSPMSGTLTSTVCAI